MKEIIVINYLLLLSASCFAQKHDYTWIMGSRPSNNDSCLNGIEITFDKEIKIDERYIDRTMNSHNISYSDKNGKLQYYTNGCCILDYKDSIIENGDSLNQTFDYGQFCTGLQEPFGIPYPNASLFLPLDDTSLLYLTLETITYPNKPPHVFSPNVLSSLININSNKVIYKNRNLLDSKLTLSREGLTACKHINNESWWVICRANLDSLFYIFLVKRDTITYTTQRLGNYYYSGEASQSTFSPNGQYYAWYSRTNGLEIMNFDRKSGVLSGYQKIKVIDTSALGFGGMAISPNNRFVYVSTQWDLFQFDLESNEIAQSVEHIQHYNETYCECSNFRIKPLYFQMQLGPDCRIYMSSSRTVNCMHVILSPNLKGKECNFIEGGIKLPGINVRSIPQFPNYRINTSSFCDSTIKFVVSASNIHVDNSFVLYPNPINDVLMVKYYSYIVNEAQLQIVNPDGKIYLQSKVLSNQTSNDFNISNFPSGLYFYNLKSRNSIIATGKILKI